MPALLDAVKGALDCATDSELADALGVGASRICNYRKRRTLPNLWMARVIARALKMPPATRNREHPDRKRAPPQRRNAASSRQISVQNAHSTTSCRNGQPLQAAISRRPCAPRVVPQGMATRNYPADFATQCSTPLPLPYSAQRCFSPPPQKFEAATPRRHARAGQLSRMPTELGLISGWL